MQEETLLTQSGQLGRKAASVAVDWSWARWGIWERGVLFWPAFPGVQSPGQIPKHSAYLRAPVLRANPFPDVQR